MERKPVHPTLESAWEDIQKALAEGQSRSKVVNSILGYPSVATFDRYMQSKGYFWKQIKNGENGWQKRGLYVDAQGIPFPYKNSALPVQPETPQPEVPVFSNPEPVREERPRKVFKEVDMNELTDALKLQALEFTLAKQKEDMERFINELKAKQTQDVDNIRGGLTSLGEQIRRIHELIDMSVAGSNNGKTKAEELEKRLQTHEVMVEEVVNKLPRSEDLVTAIKNELQGGLQQELDHRLAHIGDEKKLEEMVMKCVDGKCDLLRAELQKQAEEPEEEEEETEEEMHKTAQEYLDCPTCGPEIRKAVKEREEIRSDILSSLKESEIDQLIQNLQSSGYRINPPRPKAHAVEVW